MNTDSWETSPDVSWAFAFVAARLTSNNLSVSILFLAVWTLGWVECHGLQEKEIWSLCDWEETAVEMRTVMRIIETAISRKQRH